MSPEEFNRKLVDLTLAFPAEMSLLVQSQGPIPAGQTDGERYLIYELLCSFVGGALR